MADIGNTFLGEIWKPVPGFEGTYEVSDRGRVRRLARWISAKLGSKKLLPEIITAGFPNHRGYPTVKMFGVNRLVHQLVCHAFHGPKPTPEHEVAHNNDIKADNAASNLRWALHAENSADASRHGLYNRGSAVKAGKLTEGEVRQIRAEHQGRYGDTKTLAVKYGVRSESIIAIVKRRSWKHIE